MSGTRFLSFAMDQSEEPEATIGGWNAPNGYYHPATSRSDQLFDEGDYIPHEIGYIGGDDNIALDTLRFLPFILLPASVGDARIGRQAGKLGTHSSRRLGVNH